MTDLNNLVSKYKQQLESGDIQKAYEFLMRYMQGLKTQLPNSLSSSYTFGNISPGYIDYTYFPYYNEKLRERKLRLGLILNHKKMQFEIWLMGQNRYVQKDYWEKLKDSSWNQDPFAMPKYSIIETIIVKEANFENLDRLSKTIEEAIVHLSNQLIQEIVEVDSREQIEKDEL